MSTISESNLPGIGRKFQIEAASGDRMTIVIHDDGTRELYHFARKAPDKVASVVTLTDSEARQVAGIIGGLTYVPKALPSAEIVLEDLLLLRRVHQLARGDHVLALDHAPRGEAVRAHVACPLALLPHCLGLRHTFARMASR